jgi:hypothetical protein
MHNALTPWTPLSLPAHHNFFPAPLRQSLSCDRKHPLRHILRLISLAGIHIPHKSTICRSARIRACANRWRYGSRGVRLFAACARVLTPTAMALRIGLIRLRGI